MGGDGGGGLEILLKFQTYFLVIQEVMQNFKIVALLLLGYFWLVMKIKKELLIIIATLATAEISAGALAKADQKFDKKSMEDVLETNILGSTDGYSRPPIQASI